MIEIQLDKDYITYIDDCDVDLTQFKWKSIKGKNGNVYAIRNIKKRGRNSSVGLHRVILSRITQRELDHDEFTDHVNGNALDNRRSNIRLATNAQNQHNQKRHKDNSSGYKGVRYNKGKWMARINVNGVRMYLGIYDTPEQAHKAYCEAAKVHYGEFARFE